MSWIHAYGCVAATGDGVDELWSALANGTDCSQVWPEDTALRAFLFRERTSTSIRALLGDKLVAAFAPLAERASAAQSVTGVILASTKGYADDFVWQAQAADPSDPLTPLLQDFLWRTKLPVARSLCVSNACSSSLAALALGQLWLRQGMSQVLVLSADAVTPFVVKGFQTLKLIAAERGRPFAAERSGFLLGEAAACILLTASRLQATDIFLHEIGLDSEGSAVTRPSQSGESLRRAACRIPQLLVSPPEVIIAHGTGTPINDATEDLTLARLFGELTPPLITGTKWCVGHTLAVSGALDIIAACEALRRQQLFSLHTTQVADPTFSGHYFTGPHAAKAPLSTFSRILVSSLGFGGMHASAFLERSQP